MINESYRRLVLALLIILIINYITPAVCSLFAYIEKLQKSKTNFIKMLRKFLIQIISLGMTIGLIIEANLDVMILNLT